LLSASSVSWTELHISGHTYLQARFAERDCQPCPDRARCTSSATGSRFIAVLPQALHEIQTRNRLDQQTEQWQRRYAIRAGIESTLSQNVRAHGLRTSRYRGLTRTHVQHVLTVQFIRQLHGRAPRFPATRPTTGQADSHPNHGFC
jgi:hypothetical protein